MPLNALQAGLTALKSLWRRARPRRGMGLASPSRWLVLPGDTATRPAIITAPDKMVRLDPTIRLPAPAIPAAALVAANDAIDWGAATHPAHHDLGPRGERSIYWLSREDKLQFGQSFADLKAGGFADADAFVAWRLAPESRGDLLFG